MDVFSFLKWKKSACYPQRECDMSLTCFLGLDLAIIKHFSNNYYMNITEIVVKKKKDKKKKI